MVRFIVPLRLPRSIAAFLLWSAVATCAQAAGQSDGLAGAERVLREIAGASPLEAQRQRFGTLVVLQAAARRVTTLGGAKPTPDDMAKVGAYNRALQEVMREVSQTGAPNCQGEDCPAAQLRRAAMQLTRDEAFVRGVFEHFATPEWRAAHLATVLGRGGSAATATAPPPTAAQAPISPAAAVATGDFAFLAEMPAAERVAKEIAGADAVDTKVQQYAAFHMLAMDFMLTQRNASPNVPPRFTELDRAYKAEVMRLDRELRAEVAPPTLPPAEAAQRWAPVFRQINSYSFSGAFRQQLMQRFFSPAWIDSYERKKGQFEQWRAGAMAGPATTQGAAQPGRPPAAPTPGGAPTAPAQAPQTAPEPARAVRSASGVDMMVLGVPMGEPLRLPPCQATGGSQADLMQSLGATLGAMTGLGEGHKFMCQSSSGSAALLLGENGVGISLPRARCPDWLHMSQACTLMGMLHQGRLAMLVLTTRGEDSHDELSKDLRQKYGKPTDVKHVTWTNRLGGRWEVDELTWDLKDLLVEYKPRSKLDEAGSITVVTAEGRRFLEGLEKKRDATRPKL